MVPRPDPGVLLIALALTPAAARADLASGPVTGEVSGYLESRHHVFFGLDPDFEDLGSVLPDGYHPEERYGAAERLRPTLKLHLGEGATLVTTALAHTEHGFFDTRQNEVEDVVSLERLYLTATLDDWDHQAGKMNVAWGSGLLLNPTDLFNEKNPADLQAERRGLWALKSLWAASEETSVTFLAATPASDKACCDATLLTRLDTTLDLTDVGVEAAWRAKDDAFVFGVDLRSELTVGLWFEGAAVIPRDAPGDAATRLETGLDYSFDLLQTLYLAAEYMYQQDGLSLPGDALSKDSLRDAAVSGGGGGAPEEALADTFADRRMFAGQHYGVALVRLEIDSEWRAQVLNVTNALDHTGLVVPQLSFLPADAWTFTLGAQLTYGPKGGEYTMALPTLTPMEEVLISAVSPELGPALVQLQGARLIPAASVFLWGRYAY